MKKKVPYHKRQERWMKKNDIQIGDSVCIVRFAESGENGWEEHWVEGMNKCLGNKGRIIGIEPDEGILVLVRQGDISYEYFYPYFVLRKV